jgi:anthranilate synthase component I
MAVKGTTVAVHRTLLLDGLTPVMVLAALRVEGEPCFFLESARGGPRIARFSFVGASPSKSVIDDCGSLRFHTPHEDRPPPSLHGYKDVFDAIRADCKASKAVRAAGLPRFAGGWVGFCGWDIARGCVGLPRRKKDDPPPADGLPDAVYHRFDDVVAFDHVTNKIILISNVEVDERPNESWGIAQSRLDRMEELLIKATSRGWPPPAPVSQVWKAEPLPSKLSFEEQVALAKKHLALGDVFQVVLSRTVGMETDASPLSIYRALAAINPSPYLLYFETDGATVLGASPEALVRVQDGRVHIRPLAGTRARGETFDKDRTAEFDLLDSEKERAEHLMLVDLARNDVGMVSRLGTVSLDEYHAIERYLHVMHLTSHVSGQLDPRFDRFDALRAAFPAGTMSGAPKRRAVEIIGELEGSARGLYAGGLGYIDLGGDNATSAGGLDICIAIRCLVHRGRRVLVRTGAGIVYDSDPTLELQETEHKANSLLAAVRLAEMGLTSNSDAAGGRRKF